MDSIKDILSEELETLRVDVIDRHEKAKDSKGNSQVATGNTRDSFGWRLTGDYSGVFEGASYAGVLQTGRKGGKVPYDFKDILKRWAEAKGITFNTDADFNRFAYFVAQKIRKEGTNLYSSGNTIDIFDTPIRDFEIRLQNRLSVFYTAEIQNLIFEEWK